MSERNHFPVWILWTFAALVLFTGDALAYVGPGAGMELVGYAMSLMAWIVVAFFSVLLWPMYALIRWLRKGKIVVPKASQLPSEPVDCNTQKS